MFYEWPTQNGDGKGFVSALNVLTGVFHAIVLPELDQYLCPLQVNHIVSVIWPLI